MKKILNFLITSIVDKPENVSVEEQEQNGIINLTVAVDKEDMGKVIGKNGRIIKAIRNLMKISAIKNNKKIYINLAEVPQE